MLTLLAPGVGMGGGEEVITLIDGSSTYLLQNQYDNAMIGSDVENNKWDIL